MGAYYTVLVGLVSHLYAASHYLPIFYASSSSLLFLVGVVNGEGPISSSTTSDYEHCLHQKCGDVSVSYPFTIGLNSTCPSFKPSADDTNFTLNCTNDVLYLGENLPVLQILNDSIIVNQTSFKSTFERDTSVGNGCNVSAPSVYNLQLHFPYGSPYISADDNYLMSFGCSAGFLFTYRNKNATAYDTGGCEPFCGFDPSSFPHVDSSSYKYCGGNLNCCTSKFPAPSRVTYYSLDFLDKDSSPCSSFAVPFHPNYTNFESNSYGFRVLWALHDPVVVSQIKSWSSSSSSSNNANAVFNVADLPSSISTACTPGNSSRVSISADVMPGYQCSCLPGYEGDGYVNGSGCVDIDECNTSAKDTCVGEAECRNAPGSYTCHCESRWRVGDGRRDGTRCRISPSLIKAVAITGGVTGLMLLLTCIILYANSMVNRKRERWFFKQNGGYELQAYIAAETGRQTTRFYTAKELRDATQNFSEDLKLGFGGFGTVYRGTLEDGRLVAIKKANRPGEVDRNQFLNELSILTQINHRNIVKLYGCCLETPNPLIVYEFVSNGNLAENLSSKAAAMGWAKRLQVATEVADALAYLHAKSSPPILHRDVKTANILLDNNLDAKVADFGISKLIPEGANCVSTVVQGTLGYLDPEYFQTLELTDKSDVYSLGVVLVELITGLKAVDTQGRGVKFANLALFFLNKMAEDRLYELIDENLAIVGDDVDDMHTSIQDVAMLAEHCLALRGVERPSMSELAHKLLLLTNAFNNS